MHVFLHWPNTFTFASLYYTIFVVSDHTQTAIISERYCGSALTLIESTHICPKGRAQFIQFETRSTNQAQSSRIARARRFAPALRVFVFTYIDRVYMLSRDARWSAYFFTPLRDWFLFGVCVNKGDCKNLTTIIIFWGRLNLLYQIRVLLMVKSDTIIDKDH